MSGIQINPSRNHLFWLCQVAGWLGVAVVAISIAGPVYMDVNQSILLAGFRALLGILLTCGLRVVYRQFRARQLPISATIVGALTLSFLLAYVDVAVTRNFAVLIGLDLESELLAAFMRTGLGMRWVLYVFWSLLYFGINYLLDAQQVELNLAKAEMLARASEYKALKAQTNPHFLFNALGSIISEAGDNPKLRNMILSLSDYMRYSLQIHNDKEPLGRELDALKSYLEVEKMRFEHKLEYSVEADEVARSVPTPVALVQPLLENAIKYGQYTSPSPLRVSVTARVVDGMLIIKVTNTGAWVSPQEFNSHKTGLANLRRRLELLYKNTASLNINSDQSKVEVVVTLPLETPAGKDRGTT